MAKADLTAQRVRELFTYDPQTGVFSRIKQCGKGLPGPVGWPVRGHLAVQVDGYNQYVHRLVWLHHYGSWPKDQIDHINGIKTDNRISNLRDVPRGLNQQNFRRPNKNNTSGFLGVSWFSKTSKWAARITFDGKCKSIGYFDTKEDAYQAYLCAKRRLHAGCTI
jgi:hypothetical protein